VLTVCSIEPVEVQNSPTNAWKCCSDNAFTDT